MSKTSDSQRERFPEIYERWRRTQLTQPQAANRLGIHARTFRRWAKRYRQGGLEALRDQRGRFGRRASREEVAELVALYGQSYRDWSVRHFYEHYRDRHRGRRSITWVRKHLRAAGLVPTVRRNGHGENGKRSEPRRRQPRSGALVHQLGRSDEWVSGRWWDLIIMIDDATNRVCSGVFTEEPAFWPRLHVIRETVDELGTFARMVDGKPPRYWYRSLAPEIRTRYQVQFARVMRELGTEVVLSSSPQTTGWHGRVLRTLRDRLKNEMAAAAVSSIDDANSFLREHWPQFNAKFRIEAAQPNPAFDTLLPEAASSLDSIFCIKETKPMDHRHRVTYGGRRLQIPVQECEPYPPNEHVQVCECENGRIAVYHRSRRLGLYDSGGRPMVGTT